MSWEKSRSLSAYKLDSHHAFEFIIALFNHDKRMFLLSANIFLFILKLMEFIAIICDLKLEILFYCKGNEINLIFVNTMLLE